MISETGVQRAKKTLALLKEIYADLPLQVVITDADGIITWSNFAHPDLYGFNFFDAYIAESRFDNAHARFVITQEVKDASFKFVAGENDTLVSVDSKIYLDENESTITVLFIKDIALSRQQPEVEGKHTDHAEPGLFSFLADVIPHKMWTSGVDGRPNYYNQGWYDYTGITELTQLKQNIWDFLHPDDRGMATQKWSQAMHHSQSMQMEHRLRRHDGLYRWHLTRFGAA